MIRIIEITPAKRTSAVYLVNLCLFTSADSRSTQIWIGYDGAAGLGKSPWETPFGEIVEGMENAVDKIYGGYGDKPDQGKLHSEGESYVRENFPKMDWIKRCYVLKHDDSVVRRDAETEKNSLLRMA